MSRTENQRRASIENGRKSRGPVTVEGKNRSRRNALKHGMSGDGTVLPPELDPEIQAAVDDFNEAWKPRNRGEERLIKNYVLALIRKDRLVRADLAETSLRGREAVRTQRERQQFEIDAFLRQLPKDPVEAVRNLRRSSEGCDVLVEAWEEVREALDREGTLTAGQADRAWQLAGRQRRAPAPDASPRLVRFHQALESMRLRDPSYVPKSESNNSSQPGALALSTEQAKQIVLEFLTREQAALRERGDECWELFDLPEQAEAAQRAYFDPSPEAARRARYINDADRQMRRAMDDLRYYRRQHPHAPLDEEPLPEPPPAPVPSPEPEAPQEETTEADAPATLDSTPRRVRFAPAPPVAEVPPGDPASDLEPIEMIPYERLDHPDQPPSNQHPS